MSISENLNSIKSSLPADVILVAVSKTKPVSDLMEAYNAGQRIFGENKIQEMTEKWQEMPKDIEWHMIGHVQTNKIKFMIPYVKLIHGIDSLKLLKEINRLGIKWRKKVNCLLQVSIAQEETKFGLDESELNEILNYINNDDSATNISVVGLMGMATFTDNQEQIRNEFRYLKSIFDKTQEKNPNFQILSMGMSGDYQIAIECGSTMIRVGSSIFGTR